MLLLSNNLSIIHVISRVSILWMTGYGNIVGSVTYRGRIEANALALGLRVLTKTKAALRPAHRHHKRRDGVGRGERKVEPEGSVWRGLYLMASSSTSKMSWALAGMTGGRPASP
jgi:hypothetical protein